MRRCCIACKQLLFCLQNTLRRISNYQLKYALLRCSTTLSILVKLIETQRHGAKLCNATQVYVDVVHNMLKQNPPHRMAPKTIMVSQTRQYIRLTSLTHCNQFRTLYNCICSISKKLLPHDVEVHMRQGFFKTMQPTLCLQSLKAF